MIKSTFKHISLALPLLLITCNIYADSIGSIKPFFAAGKKSQTDGTEERDLSGAFSFHKYGFVVKTEPSQGFRYRIGFRDYKKDFDDSRDKLDNRTNIYNTCLSLPIYKIEQSALRLDTDYRLRTKRYKDSPSLEYDKNCLSGAFDLDFDKNYSLRLSGGITDYDYIKESSSNQLKSFFKVAPGLKSSDGNVAISGYCKRGWVDQSKGKKDYTENSVSVRTVLKLDTPFPYKLSGHFGYGRNDTRESEEDREDSLRFEYRLWDITSYYRLNKTIDTQLTYGQTEREYFTFVNSYDNWFLKDNTKLKLFAKGSVRLEFLLVGEHKETDFYENDNLSYKKNSLSGGFNITKRANYSFKPTLKFSSYDYPPNLTSNQKSYKLSASLKKYIGSTDNVFEVDYWYKWKDYRYKPDTEQWTLNLSFELKF